MDATAWTLMVLLIGVVITGALYIRARIRVRRAQAALERWEEYCREVGEPIDIYGYN